MTDTAQPFAIVRWSSKAAEPDLMKLLQDRLPVSLIATPRHALRTCRSDETLDKVMVRNREAFDYFPVIDAAQRERERIIGLIELVPICAARSQKESFSRTWSRCPKTT